MRPIMKLTICALAAAAMAAPAFAADIYLKLGDIKGEPAAKSAAGARIDVLSWSWGVAAPAAATNLNSSKSNRDIAVSDPGAEGKKRQHSPLTISKPLDRGSVTVHGKLPGCTVGAAYADAVLQTPAARYEFKDAIITNCAMPGLDSGGGGTATESVTIAFSSYRESVTK